MRVLVAHREPALRARIRRWLEPLGYRVDEAADADHVRRLLSDQEHLVVLLASDLSRAGEVRLVSEIKRGLSGHHTAVILIARDLALDEALVELRRGAHDFLLEPVRGAEVVARVQAAARLTSLQTELLGQARRVESLVYSDALTGLHNRRFMLNQLRALVSGARRHGRPISVILVDLDHFKRVNDTYGHETGDRALVAVASALADRLRAEDYVGRLGGEEFLAVLPDTGEEEAAAVAESLRACSAQVDIVAPHGEVVHVTASVGWATWNGEEPEALVQRADRALYTAKADGRDLVRQG